MLYLSGSFKYDRVVKDTFPLEWILFFRSLGSFSFLSNARGKELNMDLCSKSEMYAWGRGLSCEGYMRVSTISEG